MNVEHLCADITDFGYTLVETGFALHARPHVPRKISKNRTSLMWVRHRDERLMLDDPSNVYCYLSIVERKEYSYLMDDGGVTQIAYTFDERIIKRHRLLYHPCPFPVKKDDMDQFDGGLVDFIHSTFMNDVNDHLLLRSPIRFDYAPDEAADLHPASHLTLNEPGCRIPARAPLQVGTFIEFVFQNFYLDAWKHYTARIEKFPHEDEECLSAYDRRRIYLNWEPRRFGQWPK